MKLYDELVSQGNTDAANGIALVALSRVGGNDVTLSNGKTFNPSKTEITPQNIRQLFSQMFYGTDNQNSKAFDALASLLDGQSIPVAKTSQMKVAA